MAASGDDARGIDAVSDDTSSSSSTPPPLLASASSARASAEGWQAAPAPAGSAHDAHHAAAMTAALPLSAGDGSHNGDGSSAVATAAVGEPRRYKGVTLLKQATSHQWLVLAYHSATHKKIRGGLFPLDQAEAAARAYDGIVRSSIGRMALK
jgi:hypothetical protein